jgi:hypothetical protein
MSHDHVVNKLKKLMLKEESCRKIGNIEEAGVYAAKIAEWCLRYKIELASISTEAETDADNKTRGKEFINPAGVRGGRTLWWQTTLARMVCEYTGCVHVLVARSNEMILVGKEMDRQMAKYLLTLLVQFVAKESQKQYDREYYVQCEKGGRPSYVLRGYKASWIHGAVEVFRQRLDEMKKQVETEQGAVCVALVLRSDVEASRKWMNDNMMDLKNVTISGPAAVLNHRAHEAGAAAAANVSLNRPVGGGAESKALK